MRTGACVRLAASAAVLVAVVVALRGAVSHEPKILHFERLAYPLSAKVRAIQGLVVAEALVSPEGRIENAKVLSGPEALRGDTIASLKRWIFASSSPGKIIVVYWFRVSGLCEAPCPSGFEFYPPNFVIVTTGTMTVMP
jgi:hypothetical protein